MKVEIKIPQMGESINEATVSALLVENGTAVTMDQEIIELETDKVNQVLTAPKDGVLTLNVALDEMVTIGQVIGHVDTEGAPAVEAAPPPKKKEKKAPPPPPPPKKEKAPPPKPKPVTEGVRYKEEAFIADLDVEKAAPAPAAAPEKEERETRKRMSRIRQTIAKRLVEAQQTTAMLTTFNEVDMSLVMELRKRHRDEFEKKHGIRLGFMSWFVKASVFALQRIPDVNSYVDGNEAVHRNYYDIGIAVGTERGLMVPIVRDCDKLSFAQIEQQIIDYAKAARSGTISVDDLYGGGFTITNGGIYGSLLSTPILNPPQSGILGMHAIQKRPVVVDGEITIRPMMYLALSYDHRIVDGQAAVTFLVHIKECLEDPARFLLDL